MYLIIVTERVNRIMLSLHQRYNVSVREKKSGINKHTGGSESESEREREREGERERQTKSE